MDSLNATKKRKYKQRLAWTETAEQILFEMWEDKILQLRANRKNQHIYAEIAKVLQQNNFLFSALDVKNKVHNLTNRYRKERELVKASGGLPSQWPLYPKIHSFLGSYKYYNFSEVPCDDIIVKQEESMEVSGESCSYDSLEESKISTYTSDPSTSTPAWTSIQPSVPSTKPLEPSSPPPQSELSTWTLQSPPTIPSKKFKHQTEIINQMNTISDKIDKQIDKMLEMDTRMYTLESKKVDLLEQLVNKHSETMDAILDYLKKAT